MIVGVQPGLSFEAELGLVSPLLIVAIAAMALLVTGSFAAVSRSFQRPLALVALGGAGWLAWPMLQGADRYRRWHDLLARPCRPHNLPPREPWRSASHHQGLPAEMAWRGAVADRSWVRPLFHS